MLKYYIKIAFQELLNKKFYSVIIIIGFSIAIASWIFVTLWLDEELKKPSGDSLDAEVEMLRVGNDEIDEVNEVWLDSNEVLHSRLYPETPFPMAPFLKKTIPDIQEAVRFGFFGDKKIIYQNEKHTEKRFAFADNAIFSFYKFRTLDGNSISSFKDTNSVIITKAMATKYFGTENPLGKNIEIDGKYFLRVFAVIKNIPEYYKVKFDFIAPITLVNGKELIEDWKTKRVNTYIFVKKGTSIQELSNDLNSILKKNANIKADEYYFHHLTMMHTYNAIRADRGLSTYIQYIYIFSAISIFIIFIACMNYFIISISQFANRAKEIAIRKTFGASKSDIVFQILLESQILSTISLIFAIMLVHILLPQFNSLASKNIQFDIFNDFTIIAKCIIITLILGLISGSYPAFYFSTLAPTRIFSSTLRAGSRSVGFRQVIVYLQISISLALLIAAFKVDKQLNHLRNTKMGYDSECSIFLPLTDNLRNKFNSIQADLKLNKNIISVNTSINKPSTEAYNDNVIKNNEKAHIIICFKSIQIADNISYISNILKSYDSKNPFDYRFTDIDMNKEFRIETAMSRTFNFFTLASLFIMALGLFCFSSFMSEQRKAEIAIRKTFGATSTNIYFLILKEFMIISLLAIITAHITVAITTSTWLMKFSERISDFGISEFIIPTLISVLVLVISVSYHAIKAANKQPASVLKRD